jgi:signal transduction histidine kinase
MASEGKLPDPGVGPVNEGQAEYLHTFSHDLKNRVAGLLEVIRQLRSAPAVKGTNELLDFGERQSFALLSRTEEALEDLGVRTSGPQPKIERIPLHEVMTEAIADQQYRFDRKQQSVALEAQNASYAAVDPRQLKTILNALLSNASKFSPTETTITVLVRQDAVHAMIDVVDPGVGLTAADLQRVFVRYAWLGSTSTAGEAQGRSTLARCAKMASANGGRLTAKSDGPNKGSTFSLYLPVA